MKMLKRYLSATLLLCAHVALGQDKQKLIALDPGVKTGKLANGMQYYIKRNTEPSGRVVMYLANKVGSILETDNQRGLAHFMEHMNFNGTTHFPKNELVNYLQKSGVRFGADLNAYTTFDETIFQLPLPSDDSLLLGKGLQIMRDWAKGALLEGTEIDKERGVILEEKRLRTGVEQRIQDQTMPLILNHSRYAERVPIGTDEVLNHFSYKEIRTFYEDWYRPDLQALIIVGDIDEAKMEREIKRLFSDLKSPAKIRKREQYTVPLKGENHFLAITDNEMTSTYLRVLHKFPVQEVRTEDDYRKELIHSFYSRMMNARLAEAVRVADPAYINAGNGFEDLYGCLDAFTVNITLKPGEIERGVKAVYTEMEKVKRFGFTDAELKRTTESYLKGMDALYLEKNKKKSQSYADQYLNYFLGKSPAPGIEYYHNAAARIVPAIKLEEINNVIREYQRDTNRDIFVVSSSSQLPSETTVLSWISAVQNGEVAAYKEDLGKGALTAQLPAAGRIIKKTEDQQLGTTTLVLSNGVTVVLKPTTFKNNEIQLYAYSPGGTSLYSDADYESASNATALVRSSGLGTYNAVQLRNYLSGKNVQIAPYISERYEGISGVSGKEDLPQAFELIYAYFTSPRLDPDFFNASIAQARSNVVTRRSNPANVFIDTVNTLLYGNNIRKTAATVERINTINADRALAIYKERFADASDFVFTIVGSFTVEEMEPLLLKYLSVLPANGRKETARDLGLYPPDKGFSAVIKKGKEDKATVAMAYVGQYNYSQQENLLMDALSECLHIRLLERLREEEGGVYTVSVTPATYKYPVNRYSLNISFTTSPQQREKLVAAVKDELRKIKESGPSKENVEKFIAEQQRTIELKLKDNGFWLDRIVYENREGEDITGLLHYNDVLKQVTPEKIKEMAAKYFDEGKSFVFVLEKASD
ncbi:M16 family metallopeptidase [Chitinophaga sp. YR573]|uniref:M16 family metallopeptidase n=1 Tax=Chitinophaga sp. YR573 TaxID=1881040 RepID=UPI000B7EDAFE|nr:M16 family metallopeptidase [Chitinophaga sp. YR573]